MCMRTEASKLEPGRRVKVCRPATLPEAVDPLAVPDVHELAWHLTRTHKAACPSDMILVLARHTAAPLAPCACDEYADAVAAVMCAKPGPKVVCHATEAPYPSAYPRVGLADGGALSWHHCRSDMVACCTDCA